GRTGRNFVAGGPTSEQLTAFSGAPAMEPIRAYAGLDSGATTRERADIAVADLDRAGGFERGAIVVNTTTGTGWINESSTAAVEYIFNGDVAQIGMQYSYLPSWISYLADRDKAIAAGQELFEAVFAAWSQLPESSRPELYVFGESLGSYGSEAAFSSLADVVNRTDGALWVGPPSFNELHQRLVAEREPGTPQWLPIVDDGTTVRFVASPGDLSRPDADWDQPRVAYLQHPSDPIAWWSPDLLLRRPQWLTEDAPEGVSKMTWLPGVTFWQITADLPFAIEVPDGYGHNYGTELADLWVAIIEPEDWDQSDTVQLREAVTGLVR
ncbi:MAG TPA: alpha/beta-hydrolase family protein, partial [Actinomycetales bacterium]|nr:alpha/beta-hydrolase family protein [Actinomycetales bacterium]